MAADLPGLLREAAPTPGADLDFDGVSRRGRRRRWRRRAGLASLSGLALAVAVVGLGTVLEERVVLDPAGPVPAGPGVWEVIPEAPIPPRQDAIAVWTGDELLVWGGMMPNAGSYADGARFDPDSRAWRAIAESPQPYQFGHRGVWTGRELLVWGPEDGSASPPPAMTYDPASDRWTQIPWPLPYLRDAVAEWTGEQLLIWGTAGPGDPDEGTHLVRWSGGDHFAALDPGPLGERYGSTAVWTGRELLVWGGLAEQDWGGLGRPQPLADGAAYDPASDTWRPLPTAPGPARAHVQAVWTGDEAIFFGGTGAGEERLSDGVAYDPSTDSWRALPEGGFSGTVEWTGAELLNWSNTDQAPYGEERFAAYDPAADRWEEREGSGRPSTRGSAVVWAGDRLIIWGGVHWEDIQTETDILPAFADGVAYRPGSAGQDARGAEQDVASRLCSGPGMALARAWGADELVAGYGTTAGELATWQETRYGPDGPRADSPWRDRDPNGTVALCYYRSEGGMPFPSGAPAEGETRAPNQILALTVDADGEATVYTAGTAPDGYPAPPGARPIDRP